MSELHFDADIDIRKIEQKVDRIDSNLTKLAIQAANSGRLLDSSFTGATKSASDLEKQTINVGNAMKYVGAMVSLSMLAGFAKEIASVRGEWQVFEAVLTNTLGSSSDAAESLDMIAKYGAKTNFQVNELTDSYVKLVNQGFKPTREQMEALGDLAASKGKGFEQLTEAIIDAETFEFERLKGFGIRASKDGEQITFTFKGIKTTVDASAESIRNYILSLGQMEGVKGSTDAISKTIVGLASNFKDAFNQIMNSMGQQNEGIIADTIKTGTALVQNYEQVINVLKVLIATYGVYKAASVVSVILKEVDAAGSLAAALRKTAIAQGILNAAQKANPVGLTLAGITALIGGYTLWQSHLSKTSTFTSELNKDITDEVLKLDSLFKQLKTTGEGTKQRADAIKLVNERYGDYLTNLLTEKSTLEDIETAQRNVTNALIANISVEKSKDKLSEVLGDVSNKFDKEFGGFIKKFGEVYGTDRIPEFVTTINSSIDEKIKQGGGQVKRGILEYSDIAKEVYDQFIKDISQKTGFLKYDFKDFQESFLDFAEFKADKSGFIGQLEGMIAAYQQILNQFKKDDPGSGSGGGENKEQDPIKKQITDLYEKLQTADEKDRKIIAARIVTLQQELFLRQQIADNAVKAIRNETTPGAISTKKQNIFSGDVTAIKDANLEYGKLNKKIDESAKRANKLSKELSNEEAAKAWEKQKETLDQSLSFLSQMTQQYAEQLGLSEEQAKVLDSGFEAMSGIANLASGNYVQGAAQLIESALKLFIKSPEDFAEKWKGLNEQIIDTIKSLDIASQSLQNIGSSSAKASLSVIKSMMKELTEDAADLNKELEGKSYGPRRESYSNVAVSVLQQRVELEKSIEELSQKLISGNLSDKQREAIEAVLNSYNILLEKIDSITRDITGTTVSDLAQSLSDAIIDGTDAWDVWKNKAVDVIKYVTSQQLTAKLLNAPITDAVNALVKDTDDGLTSDEAKKFQDAIKAIYESVAPAYQEAIKALQAAGIDINSSVSQSAMTGTQIGASQESVSLLTGQISAARVDIKAIENISQNQLELLDQSLSALNQIVKNTSYNVRLPEMLTSLQEMVRILKEKL